MQIDRDRKNVVMLQLSQDLSPHPRDMEYNVDSKIEVMEWTGCRDIDYVSSTFREWRDIGDRIHYALRKDTERIYKIDIKGDEISEEDIHKRSKFIDNIESIIGVGNGESWLAWEPEQRWSKVLDYLEIQKIFPREKSHHNVYTTVTFNGHLWLQQKSVDRAHNQVRNQTKKCAEVFIEPPKMIESQMHIFLGKCVEKRELCEQSITLLRIQENIVIKRLAAMKKKKNGNSNDDIKKLFSPDMSSFDFIDVDNIVNREDREDI